jgi:sugar fermentation stimulation protein A
MPRARRRPAEVRYAGALRRVVFLARPNRYLALVRGTAGGRPFHAHVPNPGRMTELLVPRRTIGWVVAASGESRKTAYTLVMVRHRGTIVSVDTLSANRIVGAHLRATNGPPGPRGLRSWRREVALGHHRFDFGRYDPATGALTELLEVKSVNLRVGSMAVFPDAPTVRGTRHLTALARFARSGGRASALFLVQRDDVVAVGPNRAMDPAFAQAFDRARRAGVRFRARTVQLRPGRLSWGRAIPVRSESLAGGYKGEANPSPGR